MRTRLPTLLGPLCLALAVLPGCRSAPQCQQVAPAPVVQKDEEPRGLLLKTGGLMLGRGVGNNALPVLPNSLGSFLH